MSTMLLRESHRAIKKAFPCPINGPPPPLRWAMDWTVFCSFQLGLIFKGPILIFDLPSHTSSLQIQPLISPNQIPSTRFVDDDARSQKLLFLTNPNSQTSSNKPIPFPSSFPVLCTAKPLHPPPSPPHGTSNSPLATLVVSLPLVLYSTSPSLPGKQSLDHPVEPKPLLFALETRFLKLCTLVREET